MDLITENTRSFDERAIANKILQLASSKELSLTSMQLLKLVYLAHGWSMVLFDKPIVRGNPEAWQYGPVYPLIYSSVKKGGSTPVVDKIKNHQTGEVFFPNDLSILQNKFLQTIINSYGNWKAFRLSSITHKVGTPWYRTYHEIGKYQEIPLDFMREHFLELAKKRDINKETFLKASGA